jgi:DNA polymerase V
MDREILYKSAYKGTKKFSQHDITTANATGFGAAADDYSERGIDLNEELIMNKPATFFYRINTDAMLHSGIHAGDVLIVDRSIKAANGKIVVAAIDDEIVVRRYHFSFNKLILTADNKRYADIEVGEFSQYQSLGIVTCVVHLLEPRLIAFSKDTKIKEDGNAYIKHH